MRRKLLIGLLALGTVGGFASGFASLRHCREARRQSFEQHVAQVCVDAARKDDAARLGSAPAAYNGVPVIVQVNPAAQNAAPVVPQAVPVPAAPAPVANPQ